MKNSETFEKFFKYVLGIVLSICGFMISASYNRLNGNIQTLNKEVVELKLQITEIQAKMIDEERVNEIIEVYVLKHGLKK